MKHIATCGWAGIVAAALLLGMGSPGLAAVVASENFENPLFNASDGNGTNLNGQLGWVVNSGSAGVRNTFTTGSLDGNVWYTGVASGGHSYRHDGPSYLTASDQILILSFTGRAGGAGAAVDRYSRAGVGYFNGTSINPGIYFGSQATQWAVLLGDGTGGGSSVASSTAGFPADSLIFDARLTLNLVAKTATMEVRTSNTEETPGEWFIPSGMSNFNISGLDTSAADGKNPLNWNSLYVRGIASGDTIDNILVESFVPEPGSAGLLMVAALGVLAHRRRAERD